MTDLEAELKGGIVEALGWDAFVAEGVVKAIAEAGSQREVDEIVNDYLGGGKQVRDLVASYLSARTRETAPAQPLLPAAASASTASASTRQAPSGFARAGAARLTDMRASEGQEASSPEIVDGLPVKRPARSSRRGAVGAAPGSASQKPKPPKLERQVVNCLACGKVYDCRGTLTSDITAFECISAESGGVCTFCGHRIALTHAERSETRDTRQRAQPSCGAVAAAPSAGTAESAASKASPEAATPDAGEAAAVAFKDRLVEADRNSARRTTVVDDQADFFEIDGNAWLSDEERRALRERERAIREAEEARRKRVTVTVDLLGRQARVLMADEPEEAAEAAAGGGTAAAAAATAAEKPQGGGASLAAVREADVERQSLRITQNPNLTIHPMFVRPPPKPAATAAGADRKASGGGDSSSGSRDAGRQQQGNEGPNSRAAQHAASIGSSGQQPRQKAGKAGKGQTEAGRRKGPPRLQHDDPFTAAAVVAPD